MDANDLIPISLILVTVSQVVNVIALVLYMKGY